ncbi:MAG: DUF1573 domain-containing protein [Candidatus Zixiibacteriota bacterium]|nr:MAG: DUF1573 domain-containing protein [candidate division Zixibacteria bacterium]
MSNRSIILGYSLSIFAFVALIAALGHAAGSQDQKPKIRLSEDYWYFGYLYTGAVVHHDFWIHNSGGDTLRISKVTPGCGCTTAPLSKQDIAPGDSARLSVVFDTKNMLGKMIKDVVIKSNDPDKPEAQVTFMGVLNSEHPKVKVKPNVIRFFPSAANNNRMRKTLLVSNGFDTDIELKAIDYPRSLIKISPVSIKVKARSSVNIEVEQTVVATAEEDALGSITFEFTGPENERTTVPLVTYYKRKP